MKTLIVTALMPVLAGCHLLSDPLTTPKVIHKGSDPRVVVYRQCDKSGCRMYDRKGDRRYECERNWSNCDVK